METFNLPAGTKRFKNISIEIGKLDESLFEKATDERKRQHNASQRWKLLVRLARFADADGSSCFPEIKTLAPLIKRSERQTARYMSDLVELGWVINLGHYSRESGPRKRLLVIPNAESGLTDRAGVRDSEKQDCHIELSGLTSSTEIDEQDCHVAKAGLTCMMADYPPVLPAKNHPPTLPERLGLVFSRHGGEILNKKGIAKVQALPASDDRIVQVFESWLPKRDLTGLRCPLFKFAEEFREAEQAHEKTGETYEQLETRMEKKLADEAIQDEIDRKEREKENEFLELNKDNI